MAASRSRKRKTVSKNQPASLSLKIVAYGCLLIGIASFWGISQFPHFDNTVNGISFFFSYAFAGLIFSFFVYALLYRTVPDLKQGRKVDKEWTNLLFGLGMGFFFLTPAVASYINRTQLVDQDRCKNYRIIHKGSLSGKSPEHYLFVEVDNNKERLTVYKSYWNKFEEGQSIKLCLQKGILGYEYIRLPEVDIQ